MAQARAILEEKASIEKMPSSNWPGSKSVGHGLDWSRKAHPTGSSVTLGFLGARQQGRSNRKQCSLYGLLLGSWLQVFLPCAAFCLQWNVMWHRKAKVNPSLPRSLCGCSGTKYLSQVLSSPFPGSLLPCLPQWHSECGPWNFRNSALGSAASADANVTSLKFQWH